MSREALDQAIKRNRGQAIVADWSLGLSKATGLEIRDLRFLDPATTTDLKREFAAVLRESKSDSRKLFWPKESMNDIITYLSNKARQVEGMEVVLFSSVDEFIGGVEVQAEHILQHAVAVWSVVQQDLSLVTRDLKHGICLEESQYLPTGEYIRENVYEMTGWGRFLPDSTDHPPSSP